MSTTSRSASIPISACEVLRLPSKENGRVTTPTVRAPKSIAIFATIGAPPVPVPPPSPAVTKTISAPRRSSSISSAESSAACRPISGAAPAPSPRVTFLPISNFTSASLMMSCCESVLIAMNSTPFRPASIIRLIALTPPPPTPTTLITAK
ncbi:unannotated protein [freshwater metagenome]|uniref:Unannotated protein n=1 Tax=freshwater metagenome TaxID=449393 RepID=A0A6J7FPF4_9ZZZZ